MEHIHAYPKSGKKIPSKEIIAEGRILCKMFFLYLITFDVILTFEMQLKVQFLQQDLP